MNALPSIRQRLLRALLWWSVLGALGIAAAVWVAVQKEVTELLDETLQSAAVVLSGPLAQSTADGQDAALVKTPRPSGASTPEQFAWQVVRYAADNSAQVLQASQSAPALALFGVPLRGFGDVPAWRVYGLPLGNDGRMLYVAQTVAERGEAQLEVALSAAAASLALALLAHFWLRAKITQELQPLQNLAAQLQAFDPMNPKAALGLAERQELQAVHHAIDALGQRLARRLANERAFSAHAAHALRTPLAGIDAQLAVALRECPPDMLARLQQIRTASSRLQRVVASLLSLFRSGVELQRESVALPDWLARLAPAGLVLHIDAGMAVQADADLLAAALLNVLDNAQRHGAKSITVTLPQPQTLRLHNDGASVSAARRMALEQALHSQRYDGVTGLGLMLADIVARAHGGGLNLPEVATGFAIEMHLPLPRLPAEPLGSAEPLAPVVSQPSATSAVNSPSGSLEHLSTGPARPTV